MAGGRKLRVSCGPVATFNPSKQEAKGGSDEAQDSIVLSMSNELLYLVPELHTHNEENILHHLMAVVIPSNDTFDAVHFAVAMAPSLLFQRNNRGMTPLDYLLDRLLERPNARRRDSISILHGNVGGVGMLRNYLMLKVLVEYMDLDVRGWGEVRSRERRSHRIAERNVLHSACLLPRHSCPSDGSLLTYLCSGDASK